MNHTELPWEYIPEYNDRGSACIDIQSTEGAHVVEIYDSKDAAFIVKAVNNHYKMLNELRAMTRYAEAALRQFKDGNGTLDISLFNSLIIEAREAIEQAEK